MTMQSSMMKTKSIGIAICIFWISLLGFSEAKLTCRDFQENVIGHGQQYKPDATDLCKVCLCDQGFPTMCQSVSCSPPSCPHWEQVKMKCCQFTCLDTPLIPNNTPTDTNSTDNIVTSSDSLTTLGLRLVASTVTSFLVLALLLFAVHQLRRKRLILAMRRYSESRRRPENYQSDLFSPDYFGMECPPYEEPPPPYSPPKLPSEGHPDEAPPPYDSVDANHNLSSHTHQDPSVYHTTSPRELIRSDTAVSNHTSSPTYSRSSNMSNECPRALNNVNQNLYLSRLSSRPLYSGSTETFTLPPWNSFRRQGSNNQEHNTLSNMRHLARGISENSELGSDRASTDFGITSDAETHFNRCDSEENVVLRDLRLSNLLSVPNTSVISDTSGSTTWRPAMDLQNDAHYPENTLSNLSHCPPPSGNLETTSSSGCDNRSPEHANLSPRRRASPLKSDTEDVAMTRNERNKNIHRHGQKMDKSDKNIVFNDRVNGQNCSVV